MSTLIQKRRNIVFSTGALSIGSLSLPEPRLLDPPLLQLYPRCYREAAWEGVLLSVLQSGVELPHPHSGEGTGPQS